MDFVKLIQSLQELVFEIVVWVLLLPKTFFRALLRPDLMVKYVNSEFQKEPEKQFDDFVPPVLFYLMLAVVPAAFYTWTGQGATEEGDLPFQLTENNVLTSVLTTLISLLIYLVWIEGLNKRPLRRSGLRRLFFIQCYLVTPAQLIYTLLLAAGFDFIHPIILGLSGTLVLISYEAFAFSDELKVSLMKGLWYAALPQIALFAGLLIAASVLA
jgi:hypothetical protein